MNDPANGQTGLADSTLTSSIAGFGTSRRRFLGLAAMAVGGALIGVGTSGCGTAQTGRTQEAGGQAGRAGAAGETLFVAGHQWGPPSNFNPLAPVPAWPTTVRASQYVYESLLRFNMLDGSLHPGLGKELQQPDKQTLVVPLQDGTKWSDGSELTAEDVAHLRPREDERGSVVRQPLAVRRLHRGDRSTNGDLQAQDRPVQPGPGQGLHQQCADPSQIRVGL